MQADWFRTLLQGLKVEMLYCSYTNTSTLKPYNIPTLQQ